VGAKSWTHLEAPNGYTLIPNPLLNRLFKSGLSDREHAVFLALATRRNLHHKKATTKDLARFLRRDPRTVEKALLALWEAGLVERDATGWWLAEAALSSTSQQGVQTSQQTLQGESEENAPRDEVSPGQEIREETSSEEKNPPHPHPTPQAEEAASLAVKETARGKGEQPGGAASTIPSPSSDFPSSQESSPAFVKPGTKPLQAALKRAGLWGEFYRAFRPGFASEALWAAYLTRLEREALPLGDGFLLALDRTLKGVSLGVVRYPAAYLDRLLKDLVPPPPPAPPPSPASEEEREPLPKDALLLLPDGRRGYFAGWTGGGAKAFVEVDGVAHLVDREVVLAARVVG